MEELLQLRSCRIIQNKGERSLWLKLNCWLVCSTEMLSICWDTVCMVQRNYWFTNTSRMRALTSFYLVSDTWKLCFFLLPVKIELIYSVIDRNVWASSFSEHILSSTYVCLFKFNFFSKVALNLPSNCSLAWRRANTKEFPFPSSFNLHLHW